jgi:hypothetical protein
MRETHFFLINFFPTLLMQLKQILLVVSREMFLCVLTAKAQNSISPPEREHQKKMLREVLSPFRSRGHKEGARGGGGGGLGPV